MAEPTDLLTRAVDLAAASAERFATEVAAVLGSPRWLALQGGIDQLLRAAGSDAADKAPPHAKIDPKKVGAAARTLLSKGLLSRAFLRQGSSTSATLRYELGAAPPEKPADEASVLWAYYGLLLALSARLELRADGDAVTFAMHLADSGPIVTGRLQVDRIDVDLDLCAARAAKVHLGKVLSALGSELDAATDGLVVRDVFGVLRLSVHTAAPKQLSARLALDKDLRLAGATSDGPFNLRLDESPALLVVDLDAGSGAVAAKLDLGSLEGRWPRPATDEPGDGASAAGLPVGGFFEAKLPGLVLGVAAKAGERDVSIDPLSFGRETTQASVAGAPLFRLDLNPRHERRVTLRLRPSRAADGALEVEVPGELHLSVGVFDDSWQIDLVPAGTVLQSVAAGAGPRPDATGGIERPLLRVLKGGMSLASRGSRQPVRIPAGHVVVELPEAERRAAAEQPSAFLRRLGSKPG